jgi:hypothetical protein
MNSNNLKISDKISFTLPYLDGKFKFSGEVMRVKTTTLEVKYKTCVGENNPYKINVLTTEIPFSFVVKKN